MKQTGRIQMEIVIKDLAAENLPAAAGLWNQIVEAGNAFPGDSILTEDEAGEMFAQQTCTVCAFADGELAGLYILHPNNIGRCSHIANASYAVDGRFRGFGIGKKLVSDSLTRAGQEGFRGLQFNAVVSTNHTAVALYRKLGFQEIGRIPGGFRMPDDSYTDTLIFLKQLGE